jgi:DNA invertase Pin-like site-specific DNA recombinase
MTATPTLTRAYLYGRQSQASDRSINEQLESGRERASTEGWQVAAEFLDRVSASRHSTKQRDDWPKLVAGVEADHADVVWLWESSRGDRKAWEWLRFLETCRDRGVLIYIETDRRLYDMAVRRDWQTLAEDGVDNQAESDKIAGRVTRAMADNAVNGKPHARAPYGYRREYKLTQAGKRVLVGQFPEPAEGAVVAQIIGAVAAGETLRAVAAALNGDPVPGLPAGQDRRRKLPGAAPTPTGTRWTPGRVRDIAVNPAYAGLRAHLPGRRGGHRAHPDAKLTDATWPALVDAETWWAAYRILTDPKRRTSRPGKARHLLSLIATCGVCGGLLTVTYRQRQGRRPTYACRDRNCVRIDEADLDQHVAAEVLAWFARPQVRERIRAAEAIGNAELDAARRELAKTEASLEGWRDQARRGLITPESFAAIEPGVVEARDAARARVAELSVPPLARFLTDGAGDLAARWDGAPVSARRAFIRAFAAVTVGRSPSAGHRVDPEQRVRIEYNTPPGPGRVRIEP